MRQSYEAFAECRGLVAWTDPAKGAQHKLNVSFSQFAASNTSRPADFLAGLIPHPIARVVAHKGGGRPEIPASLRILDSTFLRLSIKLAPWVPRTARSPTLSGIRVQVHYAPAMDLPLCTLVTNHADTDYPGMEEAILDNPARLAELQAHRWGADLARSLEANLDAALVHLQDYNRGLMRVAPEWLWRDFGLRLSRGRNHGSDQRLERAALVWAIYRNFTPAQWRSERKRHYRRPGQSPLAKAGVPLGELIYLDALSV